MLASDRTAVIGSIIVMARRLGLEVVAEGIETAEQAELLLQQGCDTLQGYGIARPMPLAALLTWRPAPTSRPEAAPPTGHALGSRLGAGGRHRTPAPWRLP